MRPFRSRRSALQCSHSLRKILAKETLEPRCLLDGHGLIELVPDNYSVQQNETDMTLAVLANDVFDEEYAGPGDITSVSYGSQGGIVTIDNNAKSLTYRPPADFAGSEKFFYFVDNSAFAEVTVDINSPLRQDEFTIPPDGIQRSLDVLQNDPFWANYNGDKLITSISTAVQGDVEISADGKSVLYTPAPDGRGRDSFVYIVDELYPSTVTIHVPKVLQHDRYEIIQNSGEQSFFVMANDPFWAGYDRGKKITGVSEPNFGTASISADDRAILYTPEENRSGYVSLSYVVDGEFEEHVSIRVHRPVRDDWFEVDFNSTNQEFHVLSNDTYRADSGEWIDIIDRVTEVLPSENGAELSISNDGQSVFYSVPEGFSGVDRFTYIADNNQPAEVAVHVTRPVRNDHFHSDIYQDTPNAILHVMSNDFMGNGYQGAKVITSLDTTETKGSVSILGSTILYSPPEGYYGNDRFGYVVDGELDASVGIYVRPLAQSDRFNLCVNEVQSNEFLHVLANDYFDRGYTGPGDITSVESIDSGDLSIADSGLFLELGAQQYHRFEYTVDEKYTTNVSVSVRGHLNWDNYVVHQNSDPVPMSVVSNDFGHRNTRFCRPQDYRGARRISAVDEVSEQGGSITLNTQSNQVEYTPPADFLGQDFFNYEVDDKMSQRVEVNVIRNVRDDNFQVESGQQETLKVLVNDLFSGYNGAGRITDVTSTSQDATVSISADGSSIHYSAPEGFVGEDSFTYVVDGKQKAEATIQVGNSGEEKFDRFESMEELQEFLIADAKQRYQWQFGNGIFNRDIDDEFVAAPNADAGGADRDHSETNVQVEGIDEGDIVEFDADYVYTLSGQELVITDAWPAEEIQVVSRTLIEGRPEVEFLKGDRLTVISTITEYEEETDPINPDPFDGEPDLPGFGDFWWPQPIEVNHFTIVSVYDVTDRSSPQLVQKSTMEGQFLESRAVGDFVYLVINNEAVAPGPEIIEEELENGETRERYETEEEYEARLRANTADLIDAALPNYSSVNSEEELVRSGLLNTPEEIYKPISNDAVNLLSVVSVDIQNDEAGLAESAAVYTAGGSIVYASHQNFYVFDSLSQHEPGVEDTTITRIHKFDWKPNEGTVAFTSASTVPGSMINQFSADEYDGHLRIATTVHNRRTGNWTNASENTLFVLRDDNGTIEFEGALYNLGLNETMRSVRFMGPRAFAVTFRNVDPLFGLDLSDHSNPHSVGAITLPGFSTYMQFISDDRLLTVGRNTPNGFSGPAQVSIFDVSNLASPRMIDEYTFARFSTSEAGVDHHAFGYYAKHEMLAIPSARSYIERVDTNNDGFRETSQWITEHALNVFKIDASVGGRNDTAIQLVSEIEHDSPVRRSGYIGDSLYSIAENSIHAVSVATPQDVIGTVSDLEQIPVVDPPPVWPEWPDFADAAINAAALQLAEDLNIDAGQVVRVVTEPTDDGIEFVLRVGDDQYLYIAKDEENVTLENDNYQFPNDVVWQNPDNPMDVNGDGVVAPNDVLIQFDFINTFGAGNLQSDLTLRQIQTQSSHQRFIDANGDGQITSADPLAVINHLNEQRIIRTNPNPVQPDAPEEVVESVFEQVRGLIGDSNLDGRFDSTDFIRVFQFGEYEDDVEDNSTWERGDWDGDLDFTTRDLVFAFQYGNYSIAAEADESGDEPI